MLKGVIGNAVADRLNAAKTAVDNRVGAAKTAVADRLNGVLNNANTEVLMKLLKAEIVNIFDTMPKVVANVENIIKEIDVFFETNTIKLADFLRRRNNLIGVIKALKGVDTTHQDVVCSYYENYEDIEGDKKETKSLTSDEVKIKYDLLFVFCETLFNEYKEELDIILKYHSMISPIIIQLLRIIRENKGNTERMEKLTELRKRLEGYNERLLGYIFPQCKNKLFGGGSYKKTNKKYIYKKSRDRKEYKKINALNSDMRGGGIFDVFKANALIVKVDNQITDLKVFEQKQSQNITDLAMLIKKREKLYEVIEGLNNNITALIENYDTRGDPYKVDFSYYEEYEDIGNKKIVNKKGEGRLYVIQNTFNLQIDLCEQLFNKIKIIQDSITVEDRKAINDHIKSVNLNIDELYSSINSVSQYSYKAALTFHTKITNHSHETISPELEKRKQTLKDYLKKLNYFIHTPCIYNKIIKIPPSDPNNEYFKQNNDDHTRSRLYTGGSYKKTNKKKNILGRERCIYKKSGDRKEYLKYKGDLITVKEYKIIMRTVANHR